jgi:hypothetical protein
MGSVGFCSYRKEVLDARLERLPFLLVYSVYVKRSEMKLDIEAIMVELPRAEPASRSSPHTFATRGLTSRSEHESNKQQRVP